MAEVRYLTWTAEGLLRQPVFLRLRDDKPPEECLVPADRAREMEGVRRAGGRARTAARDADARRPGCRRSSPTRRSRRRCPSRTSSKVFWPDEGYTKGDLIEYYRAISPWLLPYLKDRPLVLTRYPDGIKGKSFFQKDAPSFAPGWVRTERVWSEHAQREIDYFVADDVETLLYIANLGTIPLHVWASRITDLAHPDWCILDLDPKGAPFAHVVRVARAIHELGGGDRPARPTSRPRARPASTCWSRSGACARSSSASSSASCWRASWPADCRTSRRPSACPATRGGRVYIDFLQNGHGKLLAAPFTARPVPGALCSAPLSWDEVDETLDLEALHDQDACPSAWPPSAATRSRRCSPTSPTS